MEERSNSQEKQNTSPSTSPQATTSEVQAPANRGEASQATTAIAEIPSDVVDAMSVVSISSHQQQQHQQQHHHQLQQFHPQQFYPFLSDNIHSESQLHHYYNAQRESMNSLQYFPSLQEHLSSSFHDEQQQLLQQHQQHFLQQQQQHLQSNYFSTPRDDCTIHVAAGKSPTENMNLTRKFLIHHETVYLSAFDAAIVIAIDAALLIQRSKYATIVRVETDTNDRVEMQHQNSHWNSSSFASIVKRPQIRITLQRNEEFVRWLAENKNDLNEL